MNKLAYIPASSSNGEVPVWIDGALRKAVQLEPDKRYEALSEFLQDLRYPNARFSNSRPTPLMERNPLLFWKVLAGVLLGLNLVLLYLLTRH